MGNTLGSSQTHSCSSWNELNQHFRMLCPGRASMSRHFRPGCFYFSLRMEKVKFCLSYITQCWGRRIPLLPSALQTPPCESSPSATCSVPSPTQAESLLAGGVPPGWHQQQELTWSLCYWSVNLGIRPCFWEEGAKGRSWTLF